MCGQRVQNCSSSQTESEGRLPVEGRRNFCLFSFYAMHAMPVSKAESAVKAAWHVCKSYLHSGETVERSSYVCVSPQMLTCRSFSATFTTVNVMSTCHTRDTQERPSLKEKAMLGLIIICHHFITPPPTES